MSEQLILTVGREFGSGGRAIATALAERFTLPLYDDNILTTLAESRGFSADALSDYDEAPRNRLFYRSVNGFSNSPSGNTAHMQFQYLRSQADAGKSFAVLGRCAEEVLRDYPGLISIFVLADPDFKLQRTMARGFISEREALSLMEKKDRSRKQYHNQYCKGKWGDSRNYDLCINSARLGIAGTVDVLEQYIRARTEEVRF